jgi:hypothetical protein
MGILATTEADRQHRLGFVPGAALSVMYEAPLSSQSTAQTLFRLLGEGLHRFFSDLSTLAPGQKGICFVQHREDFEPAPLAPFLERQRFLNGVFLAGKPTALDGLLNEGALIWSQLDVHMDIVKGFTGGQHVPF